MYLLLCQLCSSSSLTMYLTLFDSLWRVHVYVKWGTFYKPISTKVTCTNTKPYRVLLYQAQQVDRTCNPKGTLFYQPHQIFCKDPVLFLSTSSHTLYQIPVIIHHFKNVFINRQVKMEIFMS